MLWFILKTFMLLTQGGAITTPPSLIKSSVYMHVYMCSYNIMSYKRLTITVMQAYAFFSALLYNFVKHAV